MTSRRRRLLCRDRGIVSLEFTLIACFVTIGCAALIQLYAYTRLIETVDKTIFSIGSVLAQQTSINNATGSTPNNSSYYLSLAQTVSGLNMGKATILISVFNDPGNSATPQREGSTPYVLGAGSHASQVTTSTISPQSGYPFLTGDSAISVEMYYDQLPFGSTALSWLGLTAPASFIYRVAYFRPRLTTFTAQ